MAQPLKAKEVNMRGRDTVADYNPRESEKVCLASAETKGSRLTNTIKAAWEDVINLLERLEDMIHGEDDDARVQQPRCRPAIHTLELLLQNGPEAIDEYHLHAAQIISRIREMVIE